MKHRNLNKRASEQASSMLKQEYTRRKVLKMGATAGVALPLIVTLKPTEARADETTGS